jgi:tetratricopeptide (TPR) repeat protein
MRFATRYLFAIILTALPAAAQHGNGTDRAHGTAQQLFEARSKHEIGQYHVARDILLKALSESPGSAALLDELGSVEQDLGEYLEAEHYYLSALSASTQDDPERLIVWNNLGTLYCETGQYAKGDRVREQLERVPLQVLDHQPAAGAGFLGVIGLLEQARKRNDAAESYFDRSLQLFQKAYGPASIGAAFVKNSLGGLMLEAGRYEAASDLFRQAIREIEVVSGPDSPVLIQPLGNLARSETMNGHAERAEPAARRAVELSLTTFGEGHPVTAIATLEQATALRRLGRKQLAHDLEKRAKAWLRSNANRNLVGHTVDVRDLAGARMH